MSTDRYEDDLQQMQVFPPGKLFRVTYDAVVGTLRILARTRDQLDELRTAFSVENKSAFFSQQYGYKGEARLYNINAFGYFGSNLVWKILEWIKTQYGSTDCVAISQNCAEWIRSNLRPLNGVDRFDIDNVSKDRLGQDSKYEMRGYQLEAVRALLFDGRGRGLIQIPTAGGKSFILANFIWNLIKHVNSDYRFLILVPNVQLVEQFAKDLVEYGYSESEVAKFEGGMSKREKTKNDVNSARIVVANRQYVFKNKSKLPRFDCLICDEVHQFLGDSSAELVNGSEAAVKIGCSGTIPNDRYLRNQLVGMFGEVVYSEDVTKLQDEGYISKLHITSLEIFDRSVEADRNLLFNVNSARKYKADDPDMRFDDAVHAEHDYFAKWYKELYGPVLDYAAKLEGNTLFLFDKLDVGQSLFRLFKEKFPDKNAFYNDGSTKVADRENTRSEFEKTSGNFLFANVQIMSTGVSIKRLHNIVFCFSSKSTVRVIQSIGRVLRLYCDKGSANLVDCHFNFKYSSKHFVERLGLYRKFYGKKNPDETVKITI